MTKEYVIIETNQIMADETFNKLCVKLSKETITFNALKSNRRIITSDMDVYQVVVIDVECDCTSLYGKRPDGIDVTALQRKFAGIINNIVQRTSKQMHDTTYQTPSIVEFDL